MDRFELDNETQDENACEVIESLQRRNDDQQAEIDQLKADKMRMTIDNAKMSLEIERLKGENEGLMKDLKNDREVVENYRKRLYKKEGLKVICEGAGECDYDGSTCNKYDNCGEYVEKIAKAPEVG
jgi:predicted RNase H-like nuclease (RuvC/YqgF family)